MKQKRISYAQQFVAVDILEELLFCETVEDYAKLYKKIFEKYSLCEDPFTLMPCTTKDYEINSIEYDKSIMLEKYGHCDIFK